MKKCVGVVVLLSACVSSSSADCSADGTDYSYTETVSGNVRTITTNHCPNHAYTNINPNMPVAGSRTYTVPANPEYDPTEALQVSLAEQGGTIGVLYNGAMLFSGYGGPSYGIMTDYASSAAFNEGNTFDECGCHASSSTSPSYHAHIPPSCTLAQLGQTDTTHSPQLGWAHDGFPVYGPRGPSGVMMQTCTETGGTYGTDVCTDDCTGYAFEDSSIDNFTYRYYMLGTYHDAESAADCRAPSDIASAEYYPFSPACFNGCIPSSASSSSFSGDNILNTCSGSNTVDGFTSSYTAADSVQYPSGLDVDDGECTAGPSDNDDDSGMRLSASPTARLALLSSLGLVAGLSFFSV